MLKSKDNKAEARLQALKELKAEFGFIISNKQIMENLQALENNFYSPIKTKIATV